MASGGCRGVVIVVVVGGVSYLVYKSDSKTEDKGDGKDNGESEAKEEPKNKDKVDDNYLKKKGFDAHKVKKEARGTNKDGSKYDIYVDKDTGELWVYRKGGTGEGIPTGEYIK